MIFHLSFELPEPPSLVLDHESADLTPEEFRILKLQIRRNAGLIDGFVERLDLFVNKERYPRHAAFLERMRRRLDLLMEENDTFRNVLWRHYRRMDLLRKPIA